MFSSRDLSDPGIKSESPAPQGGFFTTWAIKVDIPHENFSRAGTAWTRVLGSLPTHSDLQFTHKRNPFSLLLLLSVIFFFFHLIHDMLHVSMPFSQIFPPSPSFCRRRMNPSYLYCLIRDLLRWWCALLYWVGQKVHSGFSVPNKKPKQTFGQSNLTVPWVVLQA